jgi:uncharacterized SAM-binding protein YcdF (DUF218 family)
MAKNWTLEDVVAQIDVHYAEHATDLGIPADAIIIEPRAANTGQNIDYSRHALAGAGIPVTSGLTTAS